MDPAYEQPLALDVSGEGTHLEIGKIIALDQGPWGTDDSAFRLRNGFDYWLNGNGFLKAIQTSNIVSGNRINTLGYFKFNAFTGEQPIWSFETQGAASQRDCIVYDESIQSLRLYQAGQDIPKAAGSDDIFDGAWHPLKVRRGGKTPANVELASRWQFSTHDNPFDEQLGVTQTPTPGTPFNLGHEDYTNMGSDLSMACVAIYIIQEITDQLLYDHGKFQF